MLNSDTLSLSGFPNLELLICHLSLHLSHKHCGSGQYLVDSKTVPLKYFGERMLTL